MTEVREYAVSGLCVGLLAVLLLGFAPRVQAQDSTVAGDRGATASDSMATDRLRSDLRFLLMDLVQSGAFGQKPADQISLTLDAPAERMFDFGVLVDSSSGAAARNGLMVLGTTPGSPASRLGLRSGDTMVAVNGVSLIGLGDDAGGSARAARALRETLTSLSEGALLRLRILRGGATLDFEGNKASIEIPAVHLILGNPDAVAGMETPANSGPGVAAGGCGRVSVA
jgi:hypothetical protein